MQPEHQTPMKKAIIQIQGVFAELDKQLIVLRLKAGRDKVKAKTGKCGGRMGWDEVDPEARNKIAARIKELRYLKPGFKKPVAFQRIADTLNKEGMLTLLGKKWSHGTVYNFHAKYCK